MKISAVLIDDKTDGALPIDCDITLQELNLSIHLPVLDTILLLQGECALPGATENHLFFTLNRRPIWWKDLEI